MKRARHEAILAIIQQREVETQQQLAASLKKAGFPVTQATVSRDIRELGLVKAATDAGYRYAPPADPPPQDISGRVRRAFGDYVVDITFSGYLLLVKTLPGSASVVAGALDALDMPEIAGTVAGDDVVLVVLRDGRHAPRPGVAQDVYELLQSWRERS